MISLKIKDIKNFMSSLLLGTTFDFLSVSEVTLTTYNTFNINGHINKNFYDSEELNGLPDKVFSAWPKIKPICYELIKGTKTPEKFKITFCLSSNDYENIISKSGASILPDNIAGLYIHFTYENQQLTAITATSLSIFTMDKTLDKFWDDTVKSFLINHFDAEEAQ